MCSLESALKFAPRPSQEPSQFRKVLECGSPLPLSNDKHAQKRPGAAALQKAGAPSQVHAPNAGAPAVESPQEQAIVSEAGPLPAPEQKTLPRFGDYELIELVARGGMGVVYKARQTSLNRTVALKMIHGGALAGAAEIKRFHAEAQAIAHLQHPNIVAIHEIGEHQGQHFFCMDYVAGRTLAEVVRDGPLPATRAATYVRIIAEAVQYAHEHGIIHRDLKPANVILDDQEQPHITDFGLAKRLFDSQLSTLNPQLTLSGQVLGSPNYLPPEQADPKRGAPGPASDVYALGAILYHLVTGRPPFQAESLTTLLRQVVEADPVPPRSLNPSISRDLETICLKCLAKEPRHRYATARALVDDLARCLNHEPVLARPVGPGEKAWRWCRRQPVRASLVGALVLVLVVGLVGISWEWRRAERERRTALENEQAALKNEQLALRQAYAGDMNLVQRSLEVGDLRRARSFLDRYRPKGKAESRKSKAETDLRGWEWRYLFGLCQSDANYKLTEGSNTYVNLALAPGGSVVAVRQAAGNIELWDVVKRQCLGTLTNRGSALAMGFSNDGPRLASANFNASGQPVISFWDVTTRQIVTNFPQDSPALSLAWSPDGKRMATLHIREDARVRLWDMPSGNLVREIQCAGALAGTTPIPLFSPDGTVLALGDSRGQIRLLDLGTGLPKTIPGPKEGEGVCALAFSPDGRLLAAGYGWTDSTIRLWDASTGQPRGRLEGHQGFVEKLAFSPDGQKLYSASFDQSIRIWDLARRQQIRRLQGHTWRISGLALCPDGRSLVSCAFDGSVRIWDLQAQPHPPAEVTLPTVVGWWYGASFMADSRHIITASLTDPVTTWDVVTGEAKTIPGLGTNNQSVALSPDQRLLAVGARDGTLKLWDLANQRLLRERKAHQSPILKLCFIDAGKSLLSFAVPLNLQTDLKRWEVGSGREIPLAPVARDRCFGIAVSPDERHLALTYGSAATKVWDSASGRLEATLGAETACFTPVFSRDGRLVAAALRQRARVWEVDSWRQVAVIEVPADNTYAVTFSPDGQRLVVGSWVQQDSRPALRVWDYVVERELLSLYNRGSWTGWIEFSPDGNTLLAVSRSGVAKLWRAPSWEEIEAEENEAP